MLEGVCFHGTMFTWMPRMGFHILKTEFSKMWDPEARAFGVRFEDGVALSLVFSTLRPRLLLVLNPRSSRHPVVYIFPRSKYTRPWELLGSLYSLNFK